MTTIDKTGTSIEDLIAEFKRENRIKDWELNYEVLKKPSGGFLGLFASKEAVVRFQLPDLADRAASFLDQLLKKMGINFDKITTQTEGKTVYLEIIGSRDTGLLIGKNGNMLETLQYFVNRIYEHDRSLDRIFIDAGGYRERREASFLRQFMPQFKKVRELGAPLTLDPMPASDRRIIHRYVEKDRALRTLTIGEGEMKRVVVFSAKQSEAEVLGQNKKTQNRRPFRRNTNTKKTDDTRAPQNKRG
jgi:spoIIIJ-associated protein